MQKPKVFANPINKKINNSQEVFYERNNHLEYHSKNEILRKIDEIFKSSNHVYKSRVSIDTKNNNITCDIVGKTSNSLLTLDGNKIDIDEIIDIKKI